MKRGCGCRDKACLVSTYLYLYHATAPKLQIKPIRQFTHQRPIFLIEPRIQHIRQRIAFIIGEIIVRINQEKIAHRAETPLQTAVDIKIIRLRIELKKRCPMHIPIEANF
jgi:hypothetical protein